MLVIRLEAQRIKLDVLPSKYKEAQVQKNPRNDIKIIKPRSTYDDTSCIDWDYITPYWVLVGEE